MIEVHDFQTLEELMKGPGLQGVALQDLDLREFEDRILKQEVEGTLF